MTRIKLYSFFFFILEFFIFNDTQKVNNIFEEIKQLSNEYKDLSIELAQINEQMFDGNQGIEKFISSLDLFREFTLVNSKEWGLINKENFSYFEQNFNKELEDIFNTLIDKHKKIINHNFTALSIITDDLEKLILLENNVNLFNLSRIINALPLVESNPILEKLNPLIPQTDDWGSFNKDNFFIKFSQDVLLSQKTEIEFFKNYEKKVNITNELLKNTLKKYK